MRNFNFLDRELLAKKNDPPLGRAVFLVIMCEWLVVDEFVVQNNKLACWCFYVFKKFTNSTWHRINYLAIWDTKFIQPRVFGCLVILCKRYVWVLNKSVINIVDRHGCADWFFHNPPFWEQFYGSFLWNEWRQETMRANFLFAWSGSAICIFLKKNYFDRGLWVILKLFPLQADGGGWVSRTCPR